MALSDAGGSAHAGGMTRHPHPHLAQVDEYGPEGRRTARDKRRFGALLLAVIAVVVIVGGVLVAAATHLSVQWVQLLWAVVVVVIAYGAFLWVRLTR